MSDFDAMITDAALLSTMAIRFAAKADAMAQEWAARQPAADGDSAEPDPLEPIREAMRQYEAAVTGGQHGRIASAQFVDAIYAAVAPPAAPVIVEIVETAEPEQQLQWNADESDAEGWGG